jgi:hypothetical protein
MDHRAVPATRGQLVLLALVIAAIAVAGLYSLVNASDLAGLFAVLAFTTVGGLIVYRRPAEPIGRLCLGIGVVSALGLCLRSVAVVIDRGPGPLPPAAALIAVIADLLTSLVILASGPLVVSRFPQRAAAAWQRRLEDGLLAVVTLVVFAQATRPGPLDFGLAEPVENPIHLDWIPSSGYDLLGFAFVAYGAAYLVTTVGVVIRYRRGGSVVRAQIRWFAAAAGVTLGLLILLFLTSGNQAISDVLWVAWIGSLLLPPIAIAIAILRYRLYDIDRLISNAIGYGLVTVVLFAVFAGVNLALVSQLSPLVNNEGIAVAASTLLAAALFNPLRTRVQRVVDGRFHRARYDAERLVAEFSGRLRDELDLPTLAGELAMTSRRAVEPSSSSVWLREVVR